MRDVECPYCGATVRSPDPYLLAGESGVAVPSDQKYRETCPDDHTFWVVYRRPPSERDDGDEPEGELRESVERGDGSAGPG